MEVEKHASESQSHPRRLGGRASVLSSVKWAQSSTPHEDEMSSHERTPMGVSPYIRISVLTEMGIL